MPFTIQQPTNPRTNKVRSTMPTQGTNELLLRQFLNPAQALKIQNYFLRFETELYKRGGIKQLAKVSPSTTKPALLRQWTDTLFMFGFGTTLAVFNLNDNTINTIKSDFIENITGGVRYGLDFFTCNSRIGEDIFKTTLPTITYGAQTVNFTVGSDIIQAVTGATATIIDDVDDGGTGTLVLDNINGILDAINIITDSKGGSAAATSTVTYTNTAAIVATAGIVPKCEALSIFDKSLVAISTDNDESEVLLSKQNDFTNWKTTSPDTDLGDAFSVIYSFAGRAKTSSNFQSRSTGSQSYGNILVIGYADGIVGFQRGTVVTSAGVNIQVFNEVFKELSDGMEQNSLSTTEGIYFANENGIFLLLNTSGERIDLTKDVKRERKLNFNFSDCDIAKAFLENRLYVTFREKASSNNIIFWFDTKTFNWGEIPFSVAGMFTRAAKIYGIASSSPRVLEMFDENQLDDEGLDIVTEYKQPMNTGSLESVKDWIQLDVGGDISNTAPVTIEVLGIAEEGGGEIETGISYQWTSVGVSSTESQLGVAEFGVDGFVSNPASLAPVWTPITGYQKAYGFNSYILKFSSSDKLKQVIRYATGTIREIRNQRKNVLS